ncbi:UNVERIFIED_CONTAM: hypothetical protein FKN15_047769 [Acipenser sinensis]
MGGFPEDPPLCEILPQGQPRQQDFGHVRAHTCLKVSRPVGELREISGSPVSVANYP